MGVVGRKGVEVPQLTQATLNVGHMNLHVVLKAAEWIKSTVKLGHVSNRGSYLTQSPKTSLPAEWIQHKVTN